MIINSEINKNLNLGKIIMLCRERQTHHHNRFLLIDYYLWLDVRPFDCLFPVVIHIAVLSMHLIDENIASISHQCIT